MPKFDDVSGREMIGWKKWVAAHPWGENAKWKVDTYTQENQPEDFKSPFYNKRVEIGDKEHTNTESLKSRFANRTYIPTPDSADFNYSLRKNKNPPKDS